MSITDALLKAGTTAPAFSYRDSEGVLHPTSTLHGKPYLVYFYPRDDTPGCTLEACAFRDRHEELMQAELTVIGVSGDSDASHERFRSKHALPFGLAADEDHAIARAFGAWGPKLSFGLGFEGTHRVSFLVGPDGKIVKVYPKVKPATHADQVLDDLLNL